MKWILLLPFVIAIAAANSQQDPPDCCFDGYGCPHVFCPKSRGK
uniref:Acp25 n=1 Tax=Drosophila mojavensis TaxID=7230 RepID=Q2VKC1_DROMO|nr:Acp25 [Drosophila mojavensis]